MADQRKRYVQVGVGARSGAFTRPVVETYPDHCVMVGICDSNPGRMQFCQRRFGAAGSAFKTYAPEQFDQMIQECRPDVVIVSSVDATHCDYICRALEHGCAVISEKPLTIDVASCRKILDTIDRTGGQVRVGFNVRYSPPRTQVKELLQDGCVGQVYSVDLSWLLDVKHGADYFRRWHRRREHGGSLLIHKATHHFDVINWYLDDVPEEVFAHADLRFYRPETAERLGLGNRSERCLDCAHAGECPFYYNLRRDQGVIDMYLDAEKHDQYYRDRCVFSAETDIWDTMSLSVRYRGGALLNYHLHAYSPWEGYRMAFNGSTGRLEHNNVEKVGHDSINPGANDEHRMNTTVFPLWGEPETIEVATGSGGHGGGDPRMAEDLFGPHPPADPLGRRAGHMAGIAAVMLGAAACHSIDTGKPVNLEELLGRPLQ